MGLFIINFLIMFLQRKLVKPLLNILYKREYKTKIIFNDINQLLDDNRKNENKINSYISLANKEGLKYYHQIKVESKKEKLIIINRAKQDACQYLEEIRKNDQVENKQLFLQLLKDMDVFVKD